MTSFYENFFFLSEFLALIGDKQMNIENQLKEFYSQELLTLSQFIGDKDYNMTFSCG